MSLRLVRCPEFGGCPLFGSCKCIASTGIAVGTSPVVRYSGDVRYWECPLSEFPLYKFTHQAGVQGIYCASVSNIDSAVTGTAYVVSAEAFI